MDAKPKRRRFQFSLRTLLVLVPVVGCVTGISSYYLKEWHRRTLERQKYVRMYDMIRAHGGYFEPVGHVALNAPGPTAEDLTRLLRELKNWDGLHGFSLAGTGLNDVQLKDVCCHPSLETLELGNTNITDKGLEELVGLRELTQVELTNDAITDPGLQHLTKLPKLQCIVVHGTNVTNAGLAKLKKANPGLEIVR